MFNNRKYINQLKEENENLNEWMKFWKDNYKKMKAKKEEYEDEMIRSMSSKDSYKKANIKLINDIGNLKKDIESKENRICDLIEENKELSQHNNFLENQKIQMNKEGVTLIEEMKTNFDIVAKEPKEEVTVSEIEEEFHRVCKFNESGYTCEKCKFKGNNDSGCIPSIILSNYNVTRKESK